MMWTQALVLTLFLLGSKGLSVQGTIKKSNAVTYFSDRMVNIIQNKCMNNANDTINEEAISELYAFQNCWHIVLPKQEMMEDDFYKYCLSYMMKSINCLEKFVESMAPCLEPEEAYLPEFITESYGNYNHHMCKFYQAKRTNKDKIDKCIAKFEEHPKLDPLVACYENSTIFGNNIQHIGPITKSKLCSDIKNLEICYENILNAHCDGFEELKTMRMYFLKNALANCKLN